MKRLCSLLLCLALLVTPALAVVAKPANGYVGDYAQVLDDDLERDMVQRDKTLFDSTGAAIVVVSVEFMDGLDAESYAYECFDQWGIGSEERNNGLLLVFATDDLNDAGLKKCWVMKGVGLESALSDSTLNGWLEDYFYDDFDAGDYDGAVEGFFDAAYAWMERYYAGTENTAPGGAYPEEERGSSFSLLGPLVVFTVLLIIAIVLVIALSSLFRGRGGYSYYNTYRPRARIVFWPRWRSRPRRPPPPPRPPDYRPHTGGGFHLGGASRGGGVGRSGGGSFRSSSHTSSRSVGHSSSFHSGGHSRGGGVGRR